MSYGRNLRINGYSRRVCLNLECTTRITDVIKKNHTCILDRNYCAKHQPINIRDYILNKKTLPNNYLKIDSHLKEWFEIIFEFENIISNEDIYNFGVTNFTKYKSNILSDIPDLVCKIIHLYPERNLKWYKWQIIPNNYLNKEHYRKELFNSFLLDNNIDINSNNIYDIKLELLEKHEASTLFNYYRHSIYDIISNLYPERNNLIPWYFKGIKYYFQDKNNIVNIENIKKWFIYEFVSNIEFIKQKKIPEKISEDEKIIYILKNINSNDFKNVYGGSFLWNLMRGSIFEFINKVYPEYNIKAWELMVLPCNYFKNSKGEKDLVKLKEWIEWIGNKLGYTKFEDYYNISNNNIKEYSGITILSEFYNELKDGNIKLLIIDIFKDEYKFEINKFKNSQERLRETNNKIWGCDYPMQNAIFAEKCSKNALSWKKYVFPCGTIVKYQGWENLALNELVKDGYTSNDIISSRDKVPEIWYIKNNRKHRYYVDIFIPSINKMIEVKSTRTYQLKEQDNIVLKAIECINQGFNYEIWVYGDIKGKNKKIINNFI